MLSWRRAKATCVIGSAERHGIDPTGTLHALRHRIGEAFVEAEPPDRPDSRVLAVGPARTGNYWRLPTFRPILHTE
mgnify:FL=1